MAHGPIHVHRFTSIITCTITIVCNKAEKYYQPYIATIDFVADYGGGMERLTHILMVRVMRTTRNQLPMLAEHHLVMTFGRHPTWHRQPR